MSKSRETKKRPSRFAMHMHMAVNALLYLALLVLATLLSVRLDRAITLGNLSRPLSPRSVEVMSKAVDIKCSVLLPRNNILWPPLRELLLNMREAAKPSKFEIEFIDPNFDLRESVAMARKYSIEGWTVVFSSGGRVEKVAAEELSECVGTSSESIRFTGEEVCVGAVIRLLRRNAPHVYSLTGEGERDFSSYDEISGYSDFARELVREGCTMSFISGENPIPDDCDVLIVAGPRYAPSATTMSSINDYISRGGRLLLFIDRPTYSPSGWEPLLSRFGLVPNGLSLANQIGSAITAVPCGGTHPVASGLSGSAISLKSPQLFDIDGQLVANESALPHPVPILEAPSGTWGESTPDASPVHFDVGVDRKAPFPVAYSVSSPDEASDLGMSKCRAIIIGDSDFASNAFMAGGRTANRDFAMNAVDWVSESVHSVKSSEFADGAALQLQLSGRKLRLFWVKGVLLWPFVAVAFGFFMSCVRRWIA